MAVRTKDDGQTTVLRSGTPLTLLFHVGQANLHYMGSVTLNAKYRKIGVKDGMLCQINNLSQPKTCIYTYVIYDNDIDPSTVCLNGAAAHRFNVGDNVEIIPLFNGMGVSGGDTKMLTAAASGDCFDGSQDFDATNATLSKCGSHTYYDSLCDSPPFDTLRVSVPEGAEYFGVFGKLHCVKITDTYENAPIPFISVYEKLARAANIPKGCMVHVVNVETGARWVMPLLYNQYQGSVEVHGVKNRCAMRNENMYVDDTIIVMAYGSLPWSPNPKLPRGVHPIVIVPSKAAENLAHARLIAPEMLGEIPCNSGLKDSDTITTRSPNSDNESDGSQSPRDSGKSTPQTAKKNGDVARTCSGVSTTAGGSDTEHSPITEKSAVGVGAATPKLPDRTSSSVSVCKMQPGAGARLIKRQKFNASYGRLQLEEATVNNTSNEAFQNVDLGDFEWRDDTKLEYVKSRFSVACHLLEEGSLLKASIDDEITQRTNSGNGIGEFQSRSMSYIAIPAKCEAHGDEKCALPMPWECIRDGELLTEVTNRQSGYGCSVVAHVTEKVDVVTVCGPISSKFRDCIDVLIGATCLSRWTNTSLEINFNATTPEKDDFTGEIDTVALAQHEKHFGEHNTHYMHAQIDTEDNGNIGNFRAAKHISLLAKNFSPAVSAITGGLPFGVWVNDAFLREHGLRYGDYVAAWDSDGEYHWDSLKKSPYPEICFVTGYQTKRSVKGHTLSDQSVYVDLQVCSCVWEANPHLTLSSYWKLITPAMWNLKALAKDLVSMIQSKIKKPLHEIRVLHASCGAGHLCYEMMRLGIMNLDMSDASDSMLVLNEKVGKTDFSDVWQSCVETRRRNGETVLTNAKWSELKDLDRKPYDVVLIRGNSTPYVNGIWDSRAGVQHDERKTIQEMIKSIKSVQQILAPGGFLYLDKCHEEDSGSKIFNYEKIEDFPAVNAELLRNLKVKSLWWEFVTDVERYTRTWKIQSRLEGGNVFRREITGFFLTEKILKAIARHSGFESCERHQLDAEKVYKGYVLQTFTERPKEYYDEHLERYVKVWIGDNPRNAAINWGMWNTATSWPEAQEERYQTLVKSISGVVSAGAKFRILDVGCGTGYTLDRLRRDFPAQMELGLGIDPSKENVSFAKEAFCGNNHQLHFEQLYSHELAANPTYAGQFDVIIAESAICHAPPQERKKFPQECMKLLKPGGILWFNDAIRGSRSQSGATDTEVFVMERLGFEGLWGLLDWRKMLIQAGFQDVSATDHAWDQGRSYRYLAQSAAKHGYDDLALDYTMSADTISRGCFSWGHFYARKLQHY